MQKPTSYQFRRVGFIGSFLVVAGTAAYSSYDHIRHVAVLGHQPDLVSWLLPLAVDGMMLVATLAMGEDKAAHRHPRGWARFGFWFGAAISVVANIAATAVEHPDPLSISIAALAPVLLLVAVEIISRPGKPKDSGPAISVAVLESPSLPAAPVSPAVVTPPSAPAPAQRRSRKEREAYGPRDGEEYSERQDRRIRNGR